MSYFDGSQTVKYIIDDKNRSLLSEMTNLIEEELNVKKVIFETDALTEEQVRRTCKCCIEANADFVKTSTGFLTGHNNVGATPEIIKVMMEEVGDKCQVKGSGCIRTREHFLQLIDMGIDRMGVGYKSVPVVLGLDNKVSTDNY